MMEKTSVVFLAGLVVCAAVVMSVFILLITQPYSRSARHLDEIAPDARYDIRLQKGLLAFFATVGLTASLLVTLVGSKSIDHASLHDVVTSGANLVSGAYICLLGVQLIISSKHNIVFQFTCHVAAISGIWTLLALLILASEVHSLAPRLSMPDVLYNIDVIFKMICFIAALAVFGVAINIPQAPAMEYRDQSVTSYAYGSLWGIFFFTYVNKVLQTAKKTSTLEQTDLDVLSYDFRASNLLHEFARSRGKHKSLFKRLLSTFSRYVILQYSLAVARTCLNFVPAYLLLCILNFIQAYKAADTASSQERRSIYPGLGYVLGMLIANQLIALMEAQLYHLCSALIQISTRAALNLEIYDKTLKQRNTTGKFNTIKQDISHSSAGKNTSEDTGHDKSTTGQNVMNLMTVDADRISSVSVYSPIIIEAPIGIIISMIFLLKLVGWAALPGFVVMCLFIPVSAKASSVYEKTQDRLLEAKDKRVSLMNEILQNIRQIKFQADEKYFKEKVNHIRRHELHQLGVSYAAFIGIEFCYALAPVAITVVVFGVYATFVAKLTPAIAFTSLVVMNQLRFALNELPEVIVALINAWTSLVRIEQFLDGEELDPQVPIETHETQAIVLDTVTAVFANSKDQENAFQLSKISAQLPSGELSLVTGPTGSGKTLFLSTLLGEAHIINGHVNAPRSRNTAEHHGFVSEASWILPNTVAYVAQTAWLENKSIRDNITFGAPLNHGRYQETLHVCGLEADLKLLEDGDETEIGEKGINLSGGQKARVSLARAAYSRASMVLMDDVLSALDAHVSKHVFDNCINGRLMAGRTRVLVTHQIGLCLEAAAYVVSLDNGRIKHVGAVDDLHRSGSIQNMVRELDEVQDIKHKAREEAVVEDGGSRDPATPSKVGTATENRPRKLVDEEAKNKGKVTLKCYMRYLKAYGSPIFTITIVLLAIVELALVTFGSYWIRAWSSSDAHTSLHPLSILHNKPRVNVLHMTRNGSLESTHSTKYWVGFYMLIMVSSQVAGLSAKALTFWGTVHAGRKLYQDMLHTIMQAPLRFLDTVPTGRLLNRFSKDATTVDSTIGQSLIYFITKSFELTVIILVCITVQPLFLIAAVILVVTAVYIGQQYIPATRSLKRLDSVNRSPMFETFSTTIAGITTIRAFGASDRFMAGMYAKVDNVSTAQFYNNVANRWLGIRFATTGNLFSSGLALVLILNIDKIDAGLAGFILSFALDLQECLRWVLRTYADLEQSMNAVERVFEYTDITTEAAHESLPGHAPPAAWPTRGTINIQDLELRYAPELPPVLHKINFQVRPHEKIGVVGRTGSGKTSITLALFRFLEASHGSILIDGLDISKMGLHDLRSRMTIVPQDPTLFQGTLRSNLSDDASDAELHDVLRRVHLDDDQASTDADATTNHNVFKDLDTKVDESGANFSAGQKQLLCLARALLRRTKIIVMDEATASVSTEIDALIQKTIRSEFVDSTVLTIAHRLETIIDYDRILVLGEGNILELDTPAILLRDPDSRFSGMVKAANLQVA